MLVMTDVAANEEMTVVAALIDAEEEEKAESADPPTGREAPATGAEGAACPAPAGEKAMAAQLPNSVFWGRTRGENVE